MTKEGREGFDSVELTGIGFVGIVVVVVGIVDVIVIVVAEIGIDVIVVGNSVWTRKKGGQAASRFGVIGVIGVSEGRK